MLLVKEPAPGEQYGRMAGGNTNTVAQRNQTEEEHKSHHRNATTTTKKTPSRETTNLPGTKDEGG